MKTPESKANASSPSETPQIPGYTILERLGEGSMGTVYRAKQLALDRIVAIKVLRPSLAEEKRYLERLQREAKLTARLDHPNVVKGIDFGDFGGQPFFVMEYAPGQTLRETMRTKGRFTEKEAIDIALQIAGALEHAYRHGIVHRDVKPGNVILTPEGQAKLTDLGLARRPGDPSVTHEGSTMGTPQYISPEQARNPRAVDIRSDLYSLGATLYHLVTGSPPFAGDSLADLLTKVLFERAQAASELEPSVSEGFSLVLRKMLAKEPSQRYQTAAELIEDLRRVRDHQAPHVTEKTLREPQVQKVPFNLIAIPIVLIVGAFLVWKLWPSSAADSSNPTDTPAGIALDEYRPSSEMTASHFLERYQALRELQRNSRLEAKQLQQVETFNNQYRQIAETRIDKAIEDMQRESQQLLTAKDYRVLADRYDSKFAVTFERYFGASLETVHQRAPELLNSWNDRLESGRRAFDAGLKTASESFSSALRRQLSASRARVLEFISANRFRSALDEIDWKVRNFRDEEGLSQESFPERAQPGSMEVESFLQATTAKVHESVDALMKPVMEEIESGKRTVLDQFLNGSLSSPRREFEARLSTILSRWKFTPAELPPEEGQKYEKNLSAIRLEIASREDSVRQEAALRVLQDFDRDFAPSIRQRDYEKILQEWKQLSQRPSFASVKEEIASRIHEFEALAGLRERFSQILNKNRQSSIDVREGSIWKSGKPVDGFDSRSGDFVIEQASGMRLSCSLRTVHSDTIGRVCGILDPKTNLEKENLPAKDAYAWGVLQFYEGNWERARKLLELSARKEDSEDSLRSILARISVAEKTDQARAEQREKQAKEQLDTARRLGIVGEFARAQLKYAEIFRDFADVEIIKQKREQLENEAAALQEAEKASARELTLKGLFPGAEILSMQGNRIALRYFFQGYLPAGWKASDAWAGSEGCFRRKTRCKSAAEFKSGAGPQIQIPLNGASSPRISFRLAYPYDAGFPVFAVFHANGHSFGILSGGETGSGQSASWGGAPDLYEPHFQHPGWPSSVTVSPNRFRFFRGGTYEVSIQLSNGGREARLTVDGEEVAQSKINEVPASLRDRIEFRSWESAELREVSVEGVLVDIK